MGTARENYKKHFKRTIKIHFDEGLYMIVMGVIGIITIILAIIFYQKNDSAIIKKLSSAIGFLGFIISVIGLYKTFNPEESTNQLVLMHDLSFNIPSNFEPVTLVDEYGNEYISISDSLIYDYKTSQIRINHIDFTEIENSDLLTSNEKRMDFMAYILNFVFSDFEITSEQTIYICQDVPVLQYTFTYTDEDITYYGILTSIADEKDGYTFRIIDDEKISYDLRKQYNEIIQSITIYN